MLCLSWKPVGNGLVRGFTHSWIFLAALQHAVVWWHMGNPAFQCSFPPFVFLSMMLLNQDNPVLVSSWEPLIRHDCNLKDLFFWNSFDSSYTEEHGDIPWDIFSLSVSVGGLSLWKLWGVLVEAASSDHRQLYFPRLVLKYLKWWFGENLGVEHEHHVIIWVVEIGYLLWL